jgi:hypothetical protein
MSKSGRARSPKASPIAAPRARAKKVSLTVDERVLRAMKQEAKQAGRTLSAEVSEALARELRRRRLHVLLSEYEAEHGCIGSRELEQIRQE